MEKGKGKIRRRSFLGASAMASLAGYSLLVRAPQASAKAPSVFTGIKEINADGLFSGKVEPKGSVGPLLSKVEIDCDVLVAGGGLAGVCAALSSARAGMKTVLVQDRSRLGGNSSSEIRMHPSGLPSKKTGWREGGIIEELKLENAARNRNLSWEMWDFVLYDKCVSEPNITLLLDTSVYKTEVSGDKITSAWARSDTKRLDYRINAKMYIDASGDSSMAMSAGASFLWGRETPQTFGEDLSGYDPAGTRQGSTILFTSKIYDKPMPFIAPAWVRKVNENDLRLRRIADDDLDYGYWWVELGGLQDAIKDNDQLRYELLAIVMGIWDYIKNSGKFKNVECRAMDFIGMVPGRRDTYRIVGPHIMTQQDIESNWTNFDDGVAVGGWSMDDHPAPGFNAKDRNPCRQIRKTLVYNIPFSSLYSKDISNLFMAGRNISCSHVAFTSTRVMATCAEMGQVVGTAAAECVKYGITPALLSADKTRLSELRQRLLRADQTILGLSNSDPRDLARSAKVSASESAMGSVPANVISGITLDAPNEYKHRWAAPIASKPVLTLAWAVPQKISQVRLTFDSGDRRLEQEGSDRFKKLMVLGPQPELVKDYKISAVLEDGSEKELASIKGNWQKLNSVKFAPVSAKALKITFTATNGDALAIVKEVRAEA